MRNGTLALALGLALLSSATPGSGRSRANSVAAGFDSAVIQIPGSLKKRPIQFTAGIGPALLAKLDFELTDAEGLNVVLGDRRAVVVVPAPSTDAHNRSAAAQTFILLNPRLLTGIGTPIPLEAEVVLTRDSGAKRAKVNSIVPDSVAAWRRLKEWPELRKSRAGRGVSASTIARVDKAAESVRLSVLGIFEAGQFDEVKTQDLLENYEELSEALRKATDENPDFDVSRQIALAVTGVHGERLAWEQAWEQVVPVLNPKYVEYSKAATDDSDQSLSTPSGHPKSVASSDDPPLPNKYKGFDEIQRPWPTLTYKHTYNGARATVAVCENDEAFASGTVIGKDLILTCAHAVARPGRGGSPAARNRDMLSVKIGYEFPDDKQSPERSIPATILFEGRVPDANANADPLDFTLLTAEIEELYNAPNFDAAEERIRGILADTNASKSDRMRKIADATYLPIEPLPLANFDYKEATEFDIAGHPRGHAKLVCGHGKILYPFRLEEARRDELYDNIVGKNSNPERRTELSQAFEAMYVRKADPATTDLWYQYTYGNSSPGIGVICETVAGNSGGAAVAETRPQRDAANTSDPRCVLGILVEGQRGNSDPWEPGMEHHEILLPTTAIIKELDAQFTVDANGQPLQQKWDKQYAVTLLQRDSHGKVSRRP